MIQKVIFILSANFIFSTLSMAQVTDSLVDTRDGKIYLTIQIGKQVWMAQNLNFASDDSWCYENKPENCENYGRLYAFDAAKNACPAGWHLPSDKEWLELEKFLGMPETELNKTNAWRGTNQGLQLKTDSVLGFKLLLAGYRNPPSNYNLLKSQAFFWTSTEEYGSAYFRQIYEGSPQVFRRTRPLNWAFSVRCVKD